MQLMAAVELVEQRVGATSNKLVRRAASTSAGEATAQARRSLRSLAAAWAFLSSISMPDGFHLAASRSRRWG